jgi:hypothetical protein
MSNERTLVRLDQIQPRTTQWLWPGYLALGAITDLSGDPGQAKSHLAYDIVARVTRGRPMPGATANAIPAGVVLLGGEDAIDSTVRPALEAAGANIARVRIYDPTRFGARPLKLPDELRAVEDAVIASAARLLVIDPVSCFFVGINSEEAVRRALMPLSELARRENLAVLMIRHLNKSNSSNILYRPGGTIAWTAAARVALQAIDDPYSDAPHHHLLLAVKSNLAEAPAFGYRTVMHEGAIGVEWLGPRSCTAKDLTGAASEASKLRVAQEILFMILRSGPQPSREVWARAKKEDVAKRTYQRAKATLGIKPERRMELNGRWWWECRLPEQENELLAQIRQKFEALDATAPLPGSQAVVTG